MGWTVKRLDIYDPNSYLDHPFISDERIKERHRKTPSLPEWESTEPVDYLRVMYLMEIGSLYNSTRLLYALSPELIPFFHFQVLSASRTILELLIRFQQHIREDVKLDPIGPRFNEVPWENKTRDQARRLYDKLSLATHGRHGKLYQETLAKRLERNDLSAEEQNRLDSLRKDLGDENGERIFSHYNGPLLDKFCLEIIIEIHQIVVAVMEQNHFSSKPTSNIPQNSKPK